jgi:hypothetical protein
MLEEAYGKAAMKKVRVYEWHECFYVIYVNIDDLPCR